MLLNIPEYDYLPMWESTTLSIIPDLETNMPRKSVQVVPLSDRVQQYSGDISVRQLKGPDLPADSLERLMAFRKELRGRNYERSKLKLLKAAYDGTFSQNREDLSSIFCSELVAEAPSGSDYSQRVGLLTNIRLKISHRRN